MKPWLFALCAALLATACARHAPPPLLTINAQNCAEVPDLTAAHTVPLKADSPTEVIIDETTPCLQPAGGAPRLYALFLVPESSQPFFLSVSSSARGTAVMAPYLAVLDANGAILREITRDKFVSRGGSLNTAFRPQPGDSFLLVTSDPSGVGELSSGIVARTQAAAVSTGTGFFMMNTGHENVRTLTHAHGGIVRVSAELIPQAR